MISAVAINQWVIIIIITITIMALLMLGELSLTRLNTPNSRVKLYLQTISGIIVCLLPFVVSSWIPVFIFSVFMTFLIFYSRYNKLVFFKANYRHPSYGSQIYPIVFFCLYMLCYWTDKPIYFSLPVLLFTASDGLAGELGNIFKWKPYRINRVSKTMSGSLAFFVSAFVFSSISFYFFDNSFSVLSIVGYSLLMALFTTIAEALFTKGWDNISVPFVAVLILYGLINFVW